MRHAQKIGRCSASILQKFQQGVPHSQATELSWQDFSACAGIDLRMMQMQ